VLRRRVILRSTDVLVYRGKEIDREVLDAVLGTDKRLLWAFVRNGKGDIMAVPYSEDRVVWLSESDVHQPEDVEV
jgi:hypothetical protein